MVVYQFIPKWGRSAVIVAFQGVFLLASAYLLGKFCGVIFRHTLKHGFQDNTLRTLGYVFRSRYDFHTILFQNILIVRRLRAKRSSFQTSTVSSRRRELSRTIRRKSLRFSVSLEVDFARSMRAFPGGCRFCSRGSLMIRRSSPPTRLTAALTGPFSRFPFWRLWPDCCRRAWRFQPGISGLPPVMLSCAFQHCPYGAPPFYYLAQHIMGYMSIPVWNLLIIFIE